MIDVLKQSVTILGSTGSVGANTLDVISRHPARFDVFALTASTRWESLLAQCAFFKPKFAVMVDPVSARLLADRLRAEGLKTQVLVGEAALCQVASDPTVDSVMAAIVGSAGLAPCMAAAIAGKRLLLANKEALVVGGELFLSAVRNGNATLLPIDSEHSAIFQSLPQARSSWKTQIDKIILTASGGPFLNRDLTTFGFITPDQACAHPNWVMGRKISVDSATMMNKALEVIEARYLFDVRPDQIEVVIHPQSVIHSMVQYHDASVIAQLGTPDMRVPIAYGLAYPERIESGATKLDFKDLQAMTFQPVDMQRFPSLPLAWEALSRPSGSVVLNAVNEVTVAAFLSCRIKFDQIARINQEVLMNSAFEAAHAVDEVLQIDAEARRMAASAIGQLHGDAVS
jgi:1-deoxy-D-xylulose-5-phosphate reductoisomerase